MGSSKLLFFGSKLFHWCKNFENRSTFRYASLQTKFHCIGTLIYRVFHKFSHTIDIAFVDKWFIWWLSLQNTKFTLISYTHFQKISLRSLIHDLSHSLQSNQRSSSKFAQVLIVVSALLISVLLDEDYENNIFLVKLWLFREIFSFSHLYLAKIY